ncbi:MAG: phage head morphogenesis protein [Candidatus Dormibacteraeota bacterium]|nr:phage head morphogenesis protein [Candidatus Dormibacteraeota bacterium]
MASPGELRRLDAAITGVLEALRITERDHSLAPIDKKCAKALRAGFKAQGKAFLKALATIKHEFPDPLTQEAGRRRRLRESVSSSWQPVFDSATDASEQLFVEALDEASAAAMATGGMQAIATLGVGGSFDLASPAAQRYLENHAAELVSGIDEVTRAKVARIITDGINEGLSYEKIAGLLRDLYDGFSEYEPQAHIRDRAELISTYETASAYEAGAAASVQDIIDQGIDIEKSWLTVGDDAVDEDCQGNEDQGWVAFDETFDSGDDTPPAHPGCRCTTLYQRAPGADDTGQAEAAPEEEGPAGE